MRTVLVALLAVALSVLARPVPAQERTLRIEDFHADVRVDEEGRVRVVETLRVAFEGSWNGIFRTIPVRYRTPQGLDYNLILDLDDVTNGDGERLEYEVSSERHYRKIKIWVPGAQDAVRTVVLGYSSPNALRFFDDHDELYWNVTGDEWEYPILAASARVELPPGATGLRAAAFTGGYGSTEDAADIEQLADGFSIRARRPLNFKEGLTVAVAWAPGVVARPSAALRAARTLRSNLVFLLPFLSLLAMWQVWKVRGKDPARRPIVVQYRPPEGLVPAEVGTLVDGSPDMRDLTATLVDLAVRGYVRIEEKKRTGIAGWFGKDEYVFHRTDAPAGAELHAHERALLDALFDHGTVKQKELADLEQEFYQELPGVKDGIFDRLLALGFYERRPDKVRGAWIAAGLVLSFAGAMGLVYIAQLLSLSEPAAVIAGILTGIPVVVFGFFMPSRTTSGTRAFEEILGFQEFLERVESDRFRRMIDSPQMFERYLPFAMALGVEKRWARAFEGLYTEPPSWYVGGGGPGTFRPVAFVGDLGTFSNRAATAMTSQPRSSGGSGFSGGGSSGGGFGGGGGGGF